MFLIKEDMAFLKYLLGSSQVDPKSGKSSKETHTRKSVSTSCFIGGMMRLKATREQSSGIETQQIKNLLVAQKIQAPCLRKYRAYPIFPGSSQEVSERGVRERAYLSPGSLRALTRAQRTRVYFFPQHWLLCHLGLY